MDLEVFNTRSVDEDARGKVKKKIRGLGTPSFKELEEEFVSKSWSRRKGRDE